MLMSERALRRRDAGALDTDRVAQRARDALERRLDDVVTVLARATAHVQRQSRTIDEAFPELLRELWVERPDPLRHGVDVVDEVGAAGQVERDLDECRRDGRAW